MRNYPLVAKRIEELQARNERKAEAIALKRDELIEILTEIVKVTRHRLKDARLADGLKAAEMLVKMRGWGEPERPQEHHHLHIQVNAALMEELRAGHAALLQRGSGSVNPMANRPEVALAEAVPAGEQLQEQGVENAALGRRCAYLFTNCREGLRLDRSIS